MDAQKLAHAVACYEKMRAYVDAHKKPGEGEGLDVTLDQTLPLGPAEIWGMAWPLVFFSGMKTDFAKPRSDAAKLGRWFDDFETFATAADDDRHPWHTIGKRYEKPYVPKAKANGAPPRFKNRQWTVFHKYEAVGADALAFCAGEAPYKSMPYKTGAKVVYRISKLAKFFVDLEAAAVARGRPLLEELANGPVTAAEAMENAFVKLRPAVGPITALHCLSDLGFPCHKPDIWMCRIAARCGWTPNHKESDLQRDRKDGWRVLCAACQTIADASGFNPRNTLRAFDWYVANYGMKKEPKGCPCDEIVPAASHRTAAASI